MLPRAVASEFRIKLSEAHFVHAGVIGERHEDLRKAQHYLYFLLPFSRYSHAIFFYNIGVYMLSMNDEEGELY